MDIKLISNEYSKTNGNIGISSFCKSDSLKLNNQNSFKASLFNVDSPINDSLTINEKDYSLENIDLVDSFDYMNLKMTLLRGIYAIGYEKPSMIQKKSILPMINGRDILAESQSGTGKTAAYAISMLEIVDETIFSSNEIQGLILSPTRELAQQISTVIAQLGEYMRIKVHSFIGGTSLKNDLKSLSNGVHIVVGTPGRINDLLQKKIISLSKLKLFILDEADEMLSRGFLPTVKHIVDLLDKTTQIGIFSATLQNKEILDITETILKSPVKVQLSSLTSIDNHSMLEEIRQFYLKVTEDNKLQKLFHLYKTLDISQSFIYCNSKLSVEALSLDLSKKGFSVSSIHSDYNQNDREKQLKMFRSGLTRIIVTSDLLARGIDISQIDLVVNYDLPINPETYIHRIGRTGRFGKKGIAISFVNENKLSVIYQIEKVAHTSINEYICNM